MKNHLKISRYGFLKDSCKFVSTRKNITSKGKIQMLSVCIEGNALQNKCVLEIFRRD